MATATNDRSSGVLARIDVKTVAEPGQLRELLSARLPELEKCYASAMRHVAARLTRAVATETAKNKDLARCSALSLLSCALQAAQLNLEIGGSTGQSYMVPYYNKDLGVHEAQFQLGYRGMLTLAYRSRFVSFATAQHIRKGDKFKITLGSNPGVLHEPADNPGPITHAYAVVQFKGGGCDIERPWSLTEIDDHRRKFSRQGTDPKTGERKGIWANNFDAMMLIPPLRKLLKRCPIGIDPGLMNEPTVGGEIEMAPERSAPRQLPQAAEPDLEAMMAAKGMTPGEACGWLNEQFGVVNGYDELPPVGDLHPGHREALTEFLSGLPDAQPVGAA